MNDPGEAQSTKEAYRAYRRAYFADPPPDPAFDFLGSFGITLYFEAYAAAVAYYTEVLGPPAYVEGEGTRGWPIGDGWLTLLRGRDGHPRNVEVTLEVASVAEAERLQQAFEDAGGQATPPSDQFMYRPIRACPVTDPFGTELLVIAATDTG